MADERFFVTGALGCLGAWVVHNLVREGIDVSVYDLGQSTHRLELLMEHDEIARIHFFKDDITDAEAVARAVTECGANRIIHLAALQVPFCRANPSLGAAVNVVGTVNVFEAAKQAGISSVVYASSMAVYGGAELYGPEVQDGDLLHPSIFTESTKAPTRARPASTGRTTASPASPSAPTPSTARPAIRA